MRIAICPASLLTAAKGMIAALRDLGGAPPR
jgi:hypothetical protein